MSATTDADATARQSPEDPTPPPPAPRGSWWRRNRWALAALPLALAAALLASSDRVYSWWWTAGLHRPTSGAPGEVLVFHDVLDEQHGSRPFEVTLRLDGVHETTTGWEQDAPLDLPPGTTALRVELSLEADPDAALRVCRLAIRGTDGQRYDYDSQAAGSYQPASPCVPSATPGPWPDLGIDAGADPEEGERPGRWSVAPVVVLPEGVEPEAVLVWWSAPDHAVLPIG